MTLRNKITSGLVAAVLFTSGAAFAGDVPLNDPAKEADSLRLSQAKALADLVAKKAKEEDIKKNLTALHDRYHTVSDFCYAIDKELKKKLREEAKQQ